jgi:hypothetical protein
MTTPAREVNHVDVAHRVCSANLSIRPFVFQAGFSIRPGIAVWRHTCHLQTYRDLRVARHGPGSAGTLSNVSSGIEPRCMVTSGRQPHFIAPPGASFCTTGAVDLRPGRHHRAPLGCQDCRPRHLSRSGPVLTQSLRQGQRLTLAVHDAARTYSVGSTGLGAAFFHHPVPLRTLSRAAWQAAQDHDRLGASNGQASRRWLPGRPIVIVADSAFAALDFLDVARQHATIITRLRLVAALYAPAPVRHPKQQGRSRKKGERLPALSEVLADPRTQWTSLTAPYWYGEHNRLLQVASATALWYHSGMPVIALRWILIRDPLGQFETQALLCTDVHATPAFILDCFVQRWQMEVTSEEARAHFGVKTQRQWSDKAIARTTPCLLGLYSIVTLLAQPLFVTGQLSVRGAALYPKPLATFSDTIASVRRWLWSHEHFSTSLYEPDVIKIPRLLLDRFIDSLCYAA